MVPDSKLISTCCSGDDGRGGRSNQLRDLPGPPLFRSHGIARFMRVERQAMVA